MADMVPNHSAPTVAVNLDAGATSTMGGRVTNHDAFVAGPKWFAVADGVGDCDAEHAVSQFILDTLQQQTAPTTATELIATIGMVHDVVRARAVSQNSSSIGSTLVGAALVDQLVAIYHVGDSRCYRLANGTLDLLTTDHTVAHELAAAGRIQRHEVDANRYRNVLTRALGGEIADPEVCFIRATPMRLLLCSDGVPRQLSPQSIGRVLSGFRSPQAAADRLVELAQPGTDNATAVVLDITPTSGGATP